MDKNNQAHLPDQQEAGSAVQNTQKLTLKQRMIILSRRDRMGRAKPTILRVLIFTAVLIAAMLLVKHIQVNAWNSTVVNPVPVQQDEVQLSFVGDVMLGRYVETYGQKEGFTSLFRDASQLWQKSALVFANLECAVIKQNATYTHPDGKQILIGASRTALHMMANAGVNVVGLANNHVGDFGRKGVRHTLEALDKYEVQYAGAGYNVEEAGAYKLLEADGLTVGFMSCTGVVPELTYATKDGAGVATTSYSNLYRNVNEAAAYSDILVVYLHCGRENGLLLSETQQSIAHQLIESGADIVIGAHPHILQEVEQYKDGIIFYSMGNFIFDQDPRSVRNTAMLQLNVNKTTGEGCFTVIPMRVNDFHPCVTTNSFYVSQIHHALMKNMPDTSYTTLDDGRIQIPMKLFVPGEKQTPPETEPAPETTTDTTAEND